MILSPASDESVPFKTAVDTRVLSNACGQAAAQTISLHPFISTKGAFVSLN